MKTIYLIILLTYAVPTLISALRLWFDKETTSFKKYLLYCGWAFMPVWNLVLTYFVFREFYDYLIELEAEGATQMLLKVAAIISFVGLILIIIFG
jgi:hypothetical protein